MMMGEKVTYIIILLESVIHWKAYYEYGRKHSCSIIIWRGIILLCAVCHIVFYVCNVYIKCQQWMCEQKQLNLRSIIKIVVYRERCVCFLSLLSIVFFLFWPIPINIYIVLFIFNKIVEKHIETLFTYVKTTWRCKKVESIIFYFQLIFKITQLE